MKKILNGLICAMLFGTLINHANCYDSKQAYSHTKIKGRNGYDETGKYNPSSAYSRKYSRSSNPKVADMKNANNDAIKTGLRERLEKTADPREELRKETRRYERNKDGKYVDNYKTICRNALLLAKAAFTREGNLTDLSPKEAELLAYALKVYSTEKDLKDIMLYKNIGTNMEDSLRVNILEHIELIEEVSNTVTSSKARTTLKSALKEASKFKKDNEKTIKVINGMKDKPRKTRARNLQSKKYKKS